MCVCGRGATGLNSKQQRIREKVTVSCSFLYKLETKAIYLSLVNLLGNKISPNFSLKLSTFLDTLGCTCIINVLSTIENECKKFAK